MNQDTNELLQELLLMRCPETSIAGTREQFKSTSESVHDDLDYDKGNSKHPSTLIRLPPPKPFPNQHHRRPPPPPSPPPPTVTTSSININTSSLVKNYEQDSMREFIIAENNNHIIKKKIEEMTKQVYECETSATHVNSTLEVEKAKLQELDLSMSTSSRDGTSSCGDSTSADKKIEMRKRKREYAQKSRMQKKKAHDDALISVNLLQDENDKLRTFIRQRLGEDEASRILIPDNLQKMRVNKETVHKAKNTTIKAQVKKDAERDFKYKVESENTALRESVCQCETKIRSLESKLSLRETQLTEAVTEIETVTALANSKDHSRREAEAKATELEKTIAAMQAKIERTYAIIQGKFNVLTHEKTTLKESLDSLRQGQEYALNELSQVRKEYEELRNRFNHEKSQLALERELRAMLEQKEREERNKSIALSAQMMDLTKKNTEMETQRKYLNDILDAEWRKIHKLDAGKVRINDTELKVTQEELCVVQEKFDNVKRSLPTEKILALVEYTDKMRTDAEAKVTELEKTIADIQGKFNVLTHEKTTLKESLDSLRQGQEYALNELSQVRKEYEELRNRFNHEKSQLALERELRAMLEQKEREERNKSIALSAQMMDLTKKNTEMETQRKDLNDILEAYWRMILELDEGKVRTKGIEELCILQEKFDDVKRSLQTTFDITSKPSTTSSTNPMQQQQHQERQPLMTPRQSNPPSYDESTEHQDRSDRKRDVSSLISNATLTSVTEPRQEGNLERLCHELIRSSVKSLGNEVIRRGCIKLFEHVGGKSRKGKKM